MKNVYKGPFLDYDDFLYQGSQSQQWQLKPYIQCLDCIWKMCTLEKGELQTKSERGPTAGDAQARTRLRGPGKLYRFVALMSTDVHFPPKPHV